MCIIFFVLNENAKNHEYKLILASNRDEFYARPAKVADRWSEDEFIIGGRDMAEGREGGTWLAISTKNNVFKFGALLNITGEKRDADALPRGHIVVDYLKNPTSNAEYCWDLSKLEKKFTSFNLVTIEISGNNIRPMHYSNVNNTLHEWPSNEVLGFGNSLSHQPLQKVKFGTEKFREIVNRCGSSHQSKDELVQNLMKLLCDSEKHWPDAELHRRAPDWGEHLSSICVNMKEAGYGSRTHTVILIDANNKVDFYEQTMATTDPNGEWTSTHLQTEF